MGIISKRIIKAKMSFMDKKVLRALFLIGTCFLIFNLRTMRLLPGNIIKEINVSTSWLRKIFSFLPKDNETEEEDQFIR